MARKKRRRKPVLTVYKECSISGGYPIFLRVWLKGPKYRMNPVVLGPGMYVLSDRNDALRHARAIARVIGGRVVEE